MWFLSFPWSLWGFAFAFLGNYRHQVCVLVAALWTIFGLPVRRVDLWSLFGEFGFSSHVHTFCVDLTVMDQDFRALGLHLLNLELRVAIVLRIGLHHHLNWLKHILLQVFIWLLVAVILLQDHLNVDSREVHDVLGWLSVNFHRVLRWPPTALLGGYHLESMACDAQTTVMAGFERRVLPPVLRKVFNHASRIRYLLVKSARSSLLDCVLKAFLTLLLNF